MTPDFWTERWKRKDIGFHQKSVHVLLERYWSRVAAKPGASILVPLCGKSLDMVWLAEHGHEIFGIELSDLAVSEFFAEQGLTPACAARPAGILSMGDPYAILCGDFFAVPSSATQHVSAVYDRGALVAMPPAMRAVYAAQLLALTPSGARMLVVTLDYNSAEMNGPPFPVPPDAVVELFQDGCTIECLEEREVIATHPHFAAKGVTSLRETAYLLERR